MQAKECLLLLLMNAALACGNHRQRNTEDVRQQERDRNSAAFKAGKIAHEIAKNTGKVAAAAGRKLGESAKKAGEGWKEQAREDREKSRSNR